MLGKIIYADWIKMKKTPVMTAHILIPIVMSGLFLAYYAVSGWSETSKIMAFFQAMGVGYPILIGIFAASTAEQEQNAGECQNLLTLRSKRIALISKVLIFLMLGLFAVMPTVLVFGGGFKWMTDSKVKMAVYVAAGLIMWCSAIPLYIWQMFLAFRFGKAAAIGAGIICGLISALMLTGMGMVIWKYVPAAWTARIPDTFLSAVFGDVSAFGEMQRVIPVYCVFTVLSMLYYVIWASHWEGHRISE